MSSATFYHASALEGAHLSLSDEEGAHARALRVKAGDVVHMANGAGRLFEAEVTHVKKAVELAVKTLVAEEPENRHGLHLAVAPTKNVARLEWVIEKATEMGAVAITPIECQRSERTHLKTERLEKIAISAMKQSKGLWKPAIAPLTAFDAFVKAATAPHKWMAHCLDTHARQPLSALFAHSGSLVCIGPEGDFSPEEIALAQAYGFRGLSLGARRLRTETAAVAVCVSALFNHEL